MFGDTLATFPVNFLFKSVSEKSPAPPLASTPAVSAVLNTALSGARLTPPGLHAVIAI